MLCSFFVTGLCLHYTKGGGGPYQKQQEAIDLSSDQVQHTLIYVQREPKGLREGGLRVSCVRGARMPPAKGACLEGPILEAHIGTLHSPAVSHLLSDTTFPQLGILRPGAPPSLYSCWPDPPPNNSSSIGPSLELEMVSGRRWRHRRDELHGRHVAMRPSY